MKSAMVMWMVLYCITGRISAYELLYFLAGCYLSDLILSCWYAMIGLCVFPAASLGILVLAVEPVWKVCNEFSHALQRCGLDGKGERVRRYNKRTRSIPTHAYIF